MGILVYSLLWVMQDYIHQPYELVFKVGKLVSTCRLPRNIGEVGVPYGDTEQ